MSLYDETIPAFLRMLSNLETWLTEAEELATAREFDPQQFLDSRLFVDQYPLTRQIQAACDAAKLAGARLAEVQAPVHEDGDATLEELRVRIGEVKTFLEGLDRQAIDDASSRDLALPFFQGKVISSLDYVRQFALPNFYFHATTAYAILRSNGVKLGKRTFIKDLALRDPS